MRCATKNLVFAKNLADKAAALAAQLGGTVTLSSSRAVSRSSRTQAFTLARLL